MEIVPTILNAIIQMFGMMAIGYIFYKRKLIDDDTSAKLSNMLVSGIIPITIFTSFIKPFSNELLMGLGWMVILTASSFGLVICLSHIFVEKEKPVESFCTIFPNAGFFGIPLVSAILGSEAIFYLSLYIAGFYILIWTYGVKLMSHHEAKITLKSVISNPVFIATVLGLMMFILQLSLPNQVMSALTSIGGMNSPLAMLLLGTYMAKQPLMNMFKERSVYFVSCLRLIIMPLAVMVMFSFVPDKYDSLRFIVMVVSAAPVAFTSAVFAQKYDLNYEHAAQIVSVSTLFCLITMPIILVMAEWFWSVF